MQRRMTQLESLEHWFTRLYGRMAGGRMAAACLEDGLERTALRYGHTPDMREAYNRRLDCSPQHWLSARGLMPKSLLENGIPWLEWMDAHPGDDPDKAWDAVAMRRLDDKRRRGVRHVTPTPLSDGSNSTGGRPYGFNGRRRFESLLDMGRLEWSPGMGAAPDMAADGFEDMVLTAVDLGIDPTTIPV
ncbi:hypothetical protein BLI007_04925 [Bifidobacterium longum subsp. infantis]|uniref:Uncharacterized protein n=2 Tax=Bifidobacterium longum subsp. infantis TaxID=1682 RepID=B7GR77_BIFLS|nr:hypothetical protein Blon_1218 [Bifidobacterium longum subsp. infantis ATCC 15697 = JCM 1222 = DSM 20088]MBX4249218.1 hypothetical protein [Bifidobacterium longum subsp. infantis]BAJ68835.1 hypothetical protein BLIJ_1247 [Bifidobacterium longum subsp. infantis ATCC 15697 = JCM 1222 = DSM 20088]